MCSTVPERATMSVLLTPLLEKALRRPLRLLVGPGRSLLARDALAVVASLLPKGTDHDRSSQLHQHVQRITFKLFNRPQL